MNEEWCVVKGRTIKGLDEGKYMPFSAFMKKKFIPINFKYVKQIFGHLMKKMS